MSCFIIVDGLIFYNHTHYHYQYQWEMNCGLTPNHSTFVVFNFLKVCIWNAFSLKIITLRIFRMKAFGKIPELVEIFRHLHQKFALDILLDICWVCLHIFHVWKCVFGFLFNIVQHNVLPWRKLIHFTMWFSLQYIHLVWHFTAYKNTNSKT